MNVGFKKSKEQNKTSLTRNRRMRNLRRIFIMSKNTLDEKGKISIKNTEKNGRIYFLGLFDMSSNFIR